MKRYFLYSLLLAGALAGCSGDELEGQGSALPEGEYPLRLSAEVGELQTRAGGKDTWASGDAVGIRKEGEDRVARYVIGENNALNPATPNQTLYWRTTDPATIKAWCPYEAQTNVYIDDQSKGYAAFDFLYAEGEGSYNQPTTLLFKHQMAKVEYTLVRGDGITYTDLVTATVKVYGEIRASFTEGILAAADQRDGEITSYKDGTSGSAVVVPQDMTGEPLLKVSINGNNYIYTPETEEAGNLVAGMRNTYRITVHKDRIEVSSVSGAWNDQETTSDAKEAVYRVYMPEGHGQALTYSSNVNSSTLSEGYLEVTSNSFTISYNMTSTNCMMGFTVAEDLATMTRTLSGGPGSYTYTFSYSGLHEDITLAYALYAEVGDYYYSDNTWLPYLDGAKTCIGIVFKSGAGSEDNAANYENKLADNTIHGYVVALRDAAEGTGVWGVRGTNIGELPDESSFTDKYNGYTNTNIVCGLNDYGQYWAFQQVDTYQNTVATPANSSGWYLPSIGQLQDIYNLPGRATLFTSAGGTDFKASENEGRYWSSTEKNHTDAWYYRFDGNGASSFGKNYDYTNRWCNPSYIRAVLTF